MTLTLLVVFGLWHQGHFAAATVSEVLAPAAPPRSPVAQPMTFDAGSLIIPMDTSPDGQDFGMLRAYGLVYALLRNNVPVHWAIRSSKPASGIDFSVGAGALQHVDTGAAIPIPRDYRGGPFVVAATEAEAALPVIQAWQASAGDNTVVHRLVSGSLAPEVHRTLVAAPRIAILREGNEGIAFANLNAAGIRDSVGGTWSASSPDVLHEDEVGGLTDLNDRDGALFHLPSGLPRYGHFIAMHYNTTSSTGEVVPEVRSWLAASPLTHAFMQCNAAIVFETAPGRLLTSAGLEDDGDPPNPVTVLVPSAPLVQIHGTFVVADGLLDSMRAIDRAYKPGVMTYLNLTPPSGPPTVTERIALLAGRLDGDTSSLPSNGKVTYLAGHHYAPELPISANPQTNGVRVFLNALLDGDVASGELFQEDVTLTQAAPSFINTSEITYTISYSNPGLRSVENVQLTDTLPPGATFVSATGGGTFAGGAVTWQLLPLAAGESGVQSVTVNVPADGTYTNTVTMDFSHLAVKTISAAPVTTRRDTGTPTVTINQAAGQADPASGSPITFAVVFSEPVSGFGDSSGDVALSGTAGATTAVVTGGPTTYDVAVSGTTGNGTVTVSIPAGAAIDAAANSSAASTSTDDTVTIVTAPPIDTCAAAPLLDNFNRRNGGLGSNWRGLTDTDFYRITGNRVDVQAGGPVYWNAASFGANQAASVVLGTVDTSSSSQGLLVKVQDGSVPAGGAIAVLYDAVARAVRVSTLRLGTRTWKSYGNTPVAFAHGDKLGACARANGIVSIFKNDALVAVVTLNAADQGFFNPRGGKIGLWALNARNTFFDNFGGGTVTP